VLDIYAPKEAVSSPPSASSNPSSSSSSSSLPVMVWFHGGAHRSGNATAYDGSRLCQKGDKCIVVIAQYRLGILGFFTHPELCEEQGGTSGNQGLMDHVAALEWVRDNARTFGGDPNNVTIFGQSAGGSSCTALMVAPSAKGLFHRAISQSGTGIRVSKGFSRGAFEGESDNKGIMLQQAMHVKSLADMRQIPANVLMKAVSKHGDNMLARLAVGGAGIISDGIFLPKHGVAEAFRRGEHHDKVPFIIGFNALEGGSFYPVMPVPAPEALAPEMMQYYPVDTLAKYDAVMQHLTKHDASMQEKLTRTFSRFSRGVQSPANNNDADDNKRIIAIQTLMNGDTLFGAPSELLAAHGANAYHQAVVTARKAPVYMYVFTRIPEGDFGTKIGAFHSAEIDFVFGGGRWMKGISAQGDDVLADVMSNHWVEFAHTGRVHGWQPYDANERSFMEYGQQGKHGMTVDKYMNERFDLLEEADLVGASGKKLARKRVLVGAAKL